MRFFKSFFSSQEPIWSPDSYPKFVSNIKSILPRYPNSKHIPHICNICKINIFCLARANKNLFSGGRLLQTAEKMLDLFIYLCGFTKYAE
jgi:hypothetical protein